MSQLPPNKDKNSIEHQLNLCIQLANPVLVLIDLSKKLCVADNEIPKNVIKLRQLIQELNNHMINNPHNGDVYLRGYYDRVKTLISVVEGFLV